MNSTRQSRSGRQDDEALVQPNMGSEDLRNATDKGLTGDKVPAADPAAAPLGTDAEAAGTPTPPSVAPAAPVPRDRRAPPGHAKGADAFSEGDYKTWGRDSWDKTESPRGGS